MTFKALPSTAAWRHLDARTGFEVSYFQPVGDGHLIEGGTTAVEDGQTWIVDYTIELDTAWATRRARITGRSGGGACSVTLEADGRGGWRVDGVPAAHLDGCLDVDLESSAMTNTFPVHRMGLGVGGRSAAPAAYVRATDLAVERLEQDYVRVPDEGARRLYDYVSPAFDFATRLVYDESGLVLDYPGIATRTA